MKLTADAIVPSFAQSGIRHRLAQRVADAHRGIDDSTLLSFVSGSVVDGLADQSSDVDLYIVMAELPERALLEQACRSAGGQPWAMASGDVGSGELVAAFECDGIEVQVAYTTHDTLNQRLDELLVQHKPDTHWHKLADILQKAEPLFGHHPLRALKARVATFPPELGRAMVLHHLAASLPWKLMSRLVDRDAPLWCRELQVQACYRLLGLLAAVNGRYFSASRHRRLHQFADGLEQAPPRLAERMHELLSAPAVPAAQMLHTLEGEVLALVATRYPDIDLGPVQQQRAAFVPR